MVGYYLIPSKYYKQKYFNLHIFNFKIKNFTETAKKFICTQCGTGYKKKYTLTNHLKNECGKLPRFKCPYCTYMAKRRTHIRRHIQSQHPNFEVYVIDMEQS